MSGAPVVRLARAYLRHRYAFLFYSLLLTLVLRPVVSWVSPDVELTEPFVMLNLLLAALSLPRGRIVFTVLALALIAVRLAPSWGLERGTSTPVFVVWSVIGAFAVFAAVRFSLRSTEVDTEHVYAALSAYLLAGFLFGLLDWALEDAMPGSLVVAGSEGAGRVPLSTAMYFSFTTLSTLGFGDILPRTEMARGIAMVEAVAGQLYLAVMIARLVGLHAQRQKR
jgi:hypothetical protein